jgi:uncharacterized protein
MRFLLRIIPSGPDVGSATRIIRGIASSIGGKAVNPKRTSYGALEMDVFVQSREDFDIFMAAIEPLGEIEFYRDLQEAPRFLPTADAVAEAVSLFNTERFWEAHEVLESLWRAAQGDEKRLLQGLILVCAAFVHEQKDEERVALGVAKRSLPLLSWTDRKYQGIDVDSVQRTLAGMVADEKLSLFTL